MHSKTIVNVVGALLCANFLSGTPIWSEPNSSGDSASLYQLSAKSLDGESIDFASYKGKVVLVVNTASQCGMTAQMAELEKLHERFAAKGLVVLGFPCNQLGGKEPGTNAEIARFYHGNGIKFQMFQKIDVNGDKAHPLYKFLKKRALNSLDTEKVTWNFTKFLVSRDGQRVTRYGSFVEPQDLAPDIEIEIAKK